MMSSSSSVELGGMDTQVSNGISINNDDHDSTVRFHLSNGVILGGHEDVATATAATSNVFVARTPDDICLSFHSVSIAVRSPPAHILRDVCGYVRRGGMTAIIGASGA